MPNRSQKERELEDLLLNLPLRNARTIAVLGEHTRARLLNLEAENFLRHAAIHPPAELLSPKTAATLWGRIQKRTAGSG